MNRRTLLASAVLTGLPFAATAQSPESPSPLLLRFLEMRSTEDWTIADEIIAADYAPLYSYPDIIPGRDAYKQRMASNPLNTMFDSIQYEVVASAESGDYIFFLADMRPTMHGGRELLIGFSGYLKTRDGQIVAMETYFDDQRLIQMLSE